MQTIQLSIIFAEFIIAKYVFAIRYCDLLWHSKQIEAIKPTLLVVVSLQILNRQQVILVKIRETQYYHPVCNVQRMNRAENHFHKYYKSMSPSKK